MVSARLMVPCVTVLLVVRAESSSVLGEEEEEEGAEAVASLEGYEEAEEVDDVGTVAPDA